MFKDKTTYLILFLVIVLFALVFLRVFLQKTNPTRDIQSPSPQSRSNFFVAHSINNQQIGVTDKFNVTFSKPLDPESLEYSVEPPTELELSLDNTGLVLSVSSKQIWKFDTSYKLTIKSETKSNDGEKLGSDVIINFKTAPYSGI